MPEDEKFRIGIVDVSEAAEQAARDTAEARLTASREQLRGFRGFLTRIWKHNLFNEYYRQLEIVQARKEILTQKNIYAGEAADRVAHEQAMDSIVDRFTHEYDHYESDLIHRGEIKEKFGDREEERDLREVMVQLVKDYANGTLDDEHFEEQKNRVLMERLRQQKPDLFGRSQLFAENLKEVAGQIKQAVEHGKSLDDLDNNIEVIIGQARAGVRTEARFNTVDRVVERLKQTKLGKYVNETVAASAVAIAGSIAKSATTGLASRILSWATFGGSAVVSAGVAAARESVRLEEERRLHARERAMGKEIAPGSPRREQMEQFRYQTKEANQLADELDSLIYDPETRAVRSFDIESIHVAMAKLSEIEARNHLSDEHNLDLISFSSPVEIEQERLRLDLARAEAKVRLRSYLAFHPDIHSDVDFDAELDRLADLQIRELTSGDEGIDQRNRLFAKMKRAGVAKAALKSLATGLVVGEIVHETKGLITGEITPLRWLTQWWRGELPRVDLSQAHEQIINDLGAKVKLPEHIQLNPNPDGSFSLVDEQSSRVLADKIMVNPNGTLTDESKRLLEQQGIRLSEKTNGIVEVVTREKTVGAKQYVKDHLSDMQRVRRTLWFDNDTPMYRDPRTGKLLGADLNELKLWWGGKGGLDEQDNYVFNVSHMTPRGSFHKGLSVNAQELIKEGKLKILLSLSRNTQNYVFEVSIDTQGNAVIPKDSEIGKLLFSTENDRAVFRGQFAEVALSAGEKDGVERVKLLATHVGEGIKTTTERITETITKEIPETLLDIPAEYHVEPPPIIPLFGRWPLEPIIHGPSPEEPEHAPGYYPERGSEKLKRYFSELHHFRNSIKQVEKLIEKLPKEKYQHVFDHLALLRNYSRLRPEEQQKIKDEMKRYNERYPDSKIENVYEYVSREINRIYQQIENAVLEEAKVGDIPFDESFYKTSPLTKGIDRADEVVLILDYPIGDALLTTPILMALREHFKHSRLDKKVKVISNQPALFKALKDQYDFVELIEFKNARRYFRSEGKKNRYIINAHKTFEEYDMFDLSPDEVRDLSKVMSVDWASWLKEEYPISEGRLGKYDPIPSRILRNFEVMLGQKLFDNINEMDHFLEKRKDFERESEALRSKYSIEAGKPLIVVSAGSSVMPKEYRPERWAEVIKGLTIKYPEAQILFIDDPNPEKANRYGDMVEQLKSEGRRIIRVKEGLTEIYTIMSMTDLSITPDTGLGHLSGALGKPNIMFILGNPIQWSTAKTIRIMHPEAIETYKTGKGTYEKAWRTPNSYYTEEGVGASDIEPNRVIEAVGRILEA